MQLSKAFDPVALIAALKTAGLVDAEKVISDLLPVTFDWLNSSIAMEAGVYGGFVIPVLGLLEQKAMEQITSLEAPAAPTSATPPA